MLLCLFIPLTCGSCCYMENCAYTLTRKAIYDYIVKILIITIIASKKYALLLPNECVWLNLY